MPSPPLLPGPQSTSTRACSVSRRASAITRAAAVPALRINWSVDVPACSVRCSAARICATVTILSIALTHPGDNKGYGELVGVRDADREPGDAHLLGARCRLAIEIDGGPAAAVGQDFDVAPAQPPDAGPQGLAHGLLGGEAACQTLGAPAAIGLLSGRINAVEEALAPAL